MEMQFVVNVIPKVFVAEWKFPEVGDPYQTIPVHKWEDCKEVSRREMGVWGYKLLMETLAGTRFYVLCSYK